MKPGDYKTLTGVFAPNVPEDTSLTWSSTNQDVATVDTDGKVTAVAVGNADIIAESKATGTKASCSVRVGSLSDGCQFQVNGANSTELTVVEGKSNTGVRLFATLQGNINGELVDKYQFTLTSSDESIVTVKKTTRITTSSGGYTLEITGRKPGEADITAATSTGKTAVLHVTVEPRETMTAIVSVEKFTLGQGYILEPAQVAFREGDSVAKVLTNLLEEQGYSYKYTGEVDNGFYLSSIKNADTGILKVPEEIKSMTKFDEMWSGINPDYPNLGEFAYAKQSGWIFFVNGKAADVGMSEYTLKDGDVVRLQFTLHGLGADLGGSGFGDVEALDVANKDRLTLRAADWAEHEEDFLCIQKYKDIYEHALEVLQNHMATQEEVNAAEAAMPFAEATPVTSFTVDTTELELGKGEEAAVQSSVAPAGASDQGLIYVSSDENVAKVSEDGTITGIGKGDAVITVVPRGIRLDADPAMYTKEIMVSVVLTENELLEYVKELVEALPDADKAALGDKAAIEKALKEYEALTAEQKESLGEMLQKKVTEVKEALDVLEKEYRKKLQDAIDAAKEWKKDGYTEASWNFLQDAIKDAEALLTGNFTEKEITVYVDYLKMAVDGLVKKENDTAPGRVNKDALGTLLETAELLLEKTDIYAAASLNKLKTAYTTALKVYKDEKSTQSQVDAQLKVLKNAVKALDKKSDTNPNGGQTVTNTKRRVSLSGGDVTSDMILKVTPMTASDSRVKAMQKEALTTQSLSKLYDIALLLDGEKIKLTEDADLKIYVGSAYNGKTLTVLHYVDGEVEKLSGKVRNDYLAVKVSETGAFGVIMQDADQKGTGEQIKASSVKTGDSAPVDLWLGIALLAAIASASILIWKKKKTVR